MAEHVTIVTGASRGVGRAAAVALARRGGSLALVARDVAALRETARLCESAGGNALVLPADITSEPALATAVLRTIEQLGRLDGVVNNAGYAPQAGVEQTDAALFEKTIAINLSAAMALSRLAWPHLRRAGGKAFRAPGATARAPGATPRAPGATPRAPGATASPAGEAVSGTSRSTASPSGEAVAPGIGEAVAPGIGEAVAPGIGEDVAPGMGEASAGPCIVNVSSMSAVDPLPGFVAYAAAKAGLLGLTRALAREGAAENIRSVAIILGGVETDMFRGLKGVENVPADALLTAQEVGGVIAECVLGPLAYASGEAIYLRKRL